jgi:hypothetical protein
VHWGRPAAGGAWGWALPVSEDPQPTRPRAATARIAPHLARVALPDL